MNSQICSAIKEKRIMSFKYDGGLRRVEPFCHGRSSKGKELLRGYQIAGFSKSGNPVGWKLFDVSKILGLQIENEFFIGNRQDYNPKDSAMTNIFCNI